MDTFLPAIEQPSNPIMQLIYYFTKKQFGKVMTPLKVFGARMPLAFGTFYGKISKLDKKMILPAEIARLVRIQVARINVCEFCIDIARYDAIQKMMSEAKLDALDHYQTSPLFSDAERAALAYTSELAKTKKVDPDTFSRLTKHFSEREICEIVWLIASEHVYNITNIGLNIHSDMLCQIKPQH